MIVFKPSLQRDLLIVLSWLLSCLCMILLSTYPRKGFYLGVCTGLKTREGKKSISSKVIRSG